MNDPPKRPNTDMSWALTPLAYGPPPRPLYHPEYKNCVFCGKDVMKEYRSDLCPDCEAWQNKLSDYIKDLVHYLRISGWSIHYIKRALDEGLKVNTK
jgi:hypothetical protein